ncbi:phosphatase inhibitor-domain-containing protein [Multifurca ochricompacta]|uniref:Type 1 phosphatases regulator n=1 Tax=Multifurca ochricompacta TaxID=376703 RepID=A0AAD4M0S0_9AGAM|nr:phosphatase inhibitor-domain-containing protein [Multifurca ochricompacta]
MAFVSQSGASSSISREGSHTALIVQDPEQRDVSAQTADIAVGPGPGGILRLRGGPRDRPRVVWDEEVVDNEGLGRKKSKICCIYHRPRQFDESSDEDSSETDSDSDDDGTTRPNHQYRHHHRLRQHRHADGESGGEPHNELEHKRRGDIDDQNAYERISPRKGKDKATTRS